MNKNALLVIWVNVKAIHPLSRVLSMDAILRNASSISFLSSLSLCFLPDNLFLASEIAFHCWETRAFSASMAFIMASISCCRIQTLDFNNRFLFFMDLYITTSFRTFLNGCCWDESSIWWSLLLWLGPSGIEVDSPINRSLDLSRLFIATLARSATINRCSFSMALWRCFLSSSNEDFCSY